ncbi:MAG TPA: STAS domain-containing protein [Solirubrobacteraceae bacterium]|nr:STAS domain-containing protein [Solirubrobacteraceae bacterium]
MPAFYITEDVQPDGPVVLAVSGEIDFEVSPRLSDCIDGHIKAGHVRLMLDLSEASFIDSTAIGVLAGAAMRLRKSSDGSLVLVCNVENRKIMRIFEIAGLESTVDVYHSREEAFADLAAAC